MVTYNAKASSQQVRSSLAERKEYSDRRTNGWGDRDATLFARARGMAYVSTIDLDGERLPNVSDHQASVKQNRNGQAKDIANAVAIGGTLASAIDAATPTQRRLLLTALDQAAPALRQRTALAKVGRVNRLHGLRKSVRAIIEHRHGVHGIADDKAESFFNTLLLLQAEIAFYQDSVGSEWHHHALMEALPSYCASIGENAIRLRLTCTIDWLSDLYDAAARHAVDTDTMVALPSLITSADIGRAHHISHVETRYIFPQGRHGIRSYDSKVRKRRKRTVEEAQGDAAFVREKDEVTLFFGRSRNTVDRWVREGTYDGKLAEMKAARAVAAHRPPVTLGTAVTPPTHNAHSALIEDYKAEMCIDDAGVTPVTEELPDLSRSPEFLAALAEWRGIKLASLRVYRKRGTLPVLIDAYLDHLDDIDAEVARREAEAA